MDFSQENKNLLTVVLPVRNEGKTVGEIISKSKRYANDILVVDGHSSDDTQEIAKSQGARLVLDNCLGKGDAIRVGIKEAKRDIIVFIDGDGSHDPDDIPKLVRPIIKDEADLVIGSRMKGGSDELHGTLENFFRMLGSAIITLSINLFYKTSLSDSENGFRAIRRSVAQRIRLKENVSTIEQEMLIKVLRSRYRVVEVPTHEYARKYGQSCINLKKCWFRFVYTWLKYLFFG